jgi:DNA modification methylase
MRRRKDVQLTTTADPTLAPGVTPPAPARSRSAHPQRKGTSEAVLHLGDLKPLQPNARKRTERGADMIVDSLHRFGAARSIVVDEDNVVLAGNGTTQAAAAAGIERVRVVEADGTELIAVRRRGLTAAQKAALSLADNRTAELAVWDDAVLAQLVADLPDVAQGLWSDQEWREMLGSLQPAAEDPGAQIDRAAQLQQQWNTAHGQLWEIPSRTVPGQAHRLLCGDATVADDIARLMAGAKAALVITDPPYGVGYAKKNAFLNGLDKGNRVQTPIAHDDDRPEEMTLLWRTSFALVRSHLREGASYYITAPQGGDLLLRFQLALQAAGFPLRHMLIWAKNSFVLGRSDYHYQHEPILFGWVDGAHQFYGPPGESSLWNIDRPVASKEHPTMKPVELFARAMRNSSAPGDLVLDPFAGSGTTLVAAEQVRRCASAMEIEPAYTAVILERLTGMGLHPHLVGESNAHRARCAPKGGIKGTAAITQAVTGTRLPRRRREASAGSETRRTEGST